METVMTKHANLINKSATLLGCILGLTLGTAQAEQRVAGNWLAEDIQGGGVIDRAQTTLELSADGSFHGSGGCNNYRGKAVIEGKSIAFGPVAATRMACPEALMNQEAKFFKALEKVKSWQINEQGKLILNSVDQDAQVVLVSMESKKAEIKIEVPGVDKVDTQQVTYKCGSGGLDVTYINAGPVSLATFTLEEQFIVATTVLSGSGAKYAGSQYIWWTKGENADLYDLTKGESAGAVECTASR